MSEHGVEITDDSTAVTEESVSGLADEQGAVGHSGFRSTSIMSALESLLFVADQPLKPVKLAEAIGAEVGEVRDALRALAEEYRIHDRGFQLREVAGGFQLFTHPANAPYIERLLKVAESRRLSQAALEVLSIIAYKQPVTRLDISAVRGVSSDGAVSTLFARGLIKEVGRQNTPGNPILYGTTKRFLEVFGLKNIAALPPLKDFELDDAAREQIEKNLRTEAAAVEMSDASVEESDGELDSAEAESNPMIEFEKNISILRAFEASVSSGVEE